MLARRWRARPQLARAARIMVVGRCGCIGSSCLQPSEQQFEPAGKLELSRRARQHCVPVPGWASGGLLVGSVWRCTCEPCSERWYLSSLDPVRVLGCRGSRVEAVEAPTLSKVKVCVHPRVATSLLCVRVYSGEYVVCVRAELMPPASAQRPGPRRGAGCAKPFILNAE